jgi:co-chaperonin GroES (HSP10)
MDEEKIIDQSAVATTVSEGIKYTFLDDFLVKPLDPVIVKKEFKTPVSKGESTDDSGTSANDYDEVATEVKEVESDFREGIVLKVSDRYRSWLEQDGPKPFPIKVGDTVVYRNGAGRYFDLFKDSVLLKHFDVLAVKSND